MDNEIALRLNQVPAVLEQKNYTDPVVMQDWQRKEVINAGNDALNKTINFSELSFITSTDALAQGMKVSVSGTKEVLVGAGRLSKNIASETLKQMNRYTSDVYDIGNRGRGDFSRDALMSAMGHSAMLLQNGVRMARIPTRYVVKGVDLALYNPLRIKKAAIRKELFQKTDPGINKRYHEILSGQSRKDVIHYKDRLAWNRYTSNEMKGLSLDTKTDLMYNKFRAQKVNQLQSRSALLKKLDKNMKNKQFNVRRALKGTVSNQTRKAMNKLTAGEGFEKKTMRTALRSTQGVKSTVLIARRAKFLWQIVRHPIQSIKEVLSGIWRTVVAIKNMILAIPAVLSIIVICLPAIAMIFLLMMVVTPGSYLEIQNRYNQTNISTVATPEYAANAFIYEAKERGWKDNAIIGTLAYILAEGSGMGTFTYEGYYELTGPEGKTNEKTLDNDAWKAWLKGSGRNQGLQTGRTAIGLGLIQDSDSLNGSGSENATKLIRYSETQDQPWQDTKTQLKWILDERIDNWRSYSSAFPPFDTADVDPRKTDLSPEDWCARITCGIGMPAWTPQSHGNTSFVQAHVAKVSAAREYFNNYTSFDYVSIHGGTIQGNPDFSNNDAWRTGNPFHPSYTGQCTWFAWGRFYEIYGYDPGFRGNGNQNVQELLSKHPDKFKFSTSPAPGALFSSPNPHVGIVTAVGPDSITVQEGNLNGTTDSFEVAITDWHTKTYRMSDFLNIYGNVTYAVPI